MVPGSSGAPTSANRSAPEAEASSAMLGEGLDVRRERRAAVDAVHVRAAPVARAARPGRRQASDRGADLASRRSRGRGARRGPGRRLDVRATAAVSDARAAAVMDDDGHLAGCRGARPRRARRRGPGAARAASGRGPCGSPARSPTPLTRTWVRAGADAAQLGGDREGGSAAPEQPDLRLAGQRRASAGRGRVVAVRAGAAPGRRRPVVTPGQQPRHCRSATGAAARLRRARWSSASLRRSRPPAGRGQRGELWACARVREPDRRRRRPPRRRHSRRRAPAPSRGAVSVPARTPCPIASTHTAYAESVHRAPARGAAVPSREPTAGRAGERRPRRAP